MSRSVVNELGPEPVVPPQIAERAARPRAASGRARERRRSTHAEQRGRRPERDERARRRGRSRRRGSGRRCSSGCSRMHASESVGAEHDLDAAVLARARRRRVRRDRLGHAVRERPCTRPSGKFVGDCFSSHVLTANARCSESFMVGVGGALRCRCGRGSRRACRSATTRSLSSCSSSRSRLARERRRCRCRTGCPTRGG